MPKRVITLNDFSGGLNTDKSARALEDNELAECTNFDVSSKGKIVTSRKFKSTGLYGDQDDDASTSGEAPAEHEPGYGLFAFSNDYTLAATPAAFSGEFIVKMANTDVDILQVATTGVNSDVWYEASEYASSGITSAAVKPAFYAAEGDLFVGGTDGSDAFVVPSSLVYHGHDQIPTATITDVNVWDVHHQNKLAPDGDTAGRAQVIFQASPDNITDNVTVSAQDKLHWIIRPTTTEGLWINNDNTPTEVYEYKGTWLYKGGGPSYHSESDMFTLDTGDTMAGADDFSDVGIQVQAWYGNAAGVTAASQHIYGARLYVRYAGDSGDYFLLAEMSLEKGIKGDGETEWSSWVAASDEFDHATDSGDTCTTGVITAPPSLLTYKINNGYATSDIPSSRLVYFKTAVIANSRAYVGNVKINGRTYGDRILKSSIFQYDVFTESNFLDVAMNDGDQITALAGYGDRILEFKRNAVYIINVSKELEFLEDEQQGAGVVYQAAVTTTPFGVVWVNTNGCYLYDGEKVSQLQIGKISSSDWEGNVTPLASIGYDPAHQQVVVLWTADNGTNAYVFDAETGGWHKVSDIISGTSNTTNMVNARGDKLLVGGGAAHDDINFLADRIAAPGSAIFDLRTKVFDFGNPESKKNLLEVAVVYKYGHVDLDINISTDDGASFTEVGGLTDADSAIDTVEIDVSGIAAFQGKKTFQVQIEGDCHQSFELYSITLTYRDLGVH